MKILPKKTDIDKAKADERRREIDEGMKLAKSVDKLREARLAEEKSLKEWRDNNLAKVQQEIDSKIQINDGLKIEIKEAEAHKKKLIEPLDKEWKEINLAREELKEEKERIYLSGEQLKLKEQKVEDEQREVCQIIVRQKQNEQKTIKAKDEAVSLKDLAQREYEVAREERIAQTDTYEKKLLGLSQRDKEYEVALQTIEIRENQVKEKEAELIKREKDLARRQRNFQIAQEALKK